MAEKTLTRAQLLTLFSGGPPAQGLAVKAQVERAIAALGWQAKAAYTKQDVQDLTTQLAHLAQADLAQSPDPSAQRMASKLGPLLEEVDLRRASPREEA